MRPRAFASLAGIVFVFVLIGPAFSETSTKESNYYGGNAVWEPVKMAGDELCSRPGPLWFLACRLAAPRTGDVQELTGPFDFSIPQGSTQISVLVEDKLSPTIPASYIVTSHYHHGVLSQGSFCSQTAMALPQGAAWVQVSVGAESDECEGIATVGRVLVEFE